MAVRATLSLLAHCNNHCVFCAQHGRASIDLDAQSITTALTSLRARHDELTLVGGEPLLFEGLADVVREARALGFVRVGVQSNLRRLADTRFAEDLARAGLTDVHGSLHGAEAAVHDHHTGIEGSFAESIAGIAAARALGLTAVVTTVLTRSNFRVLAPLPRVLHARGVAAWSLALVDDAGRARPQFGRLHPRLALAVPFALHAMEAARSLSIATWIRGVPLCLLGPLAAHVLDDPARAFAPVCDGCPHRARCPGVAERYLAQFNGDELAPRSNVSATAQRSAAHEALARMFVGVGERVLDAPVATTASPRRALPVTR